MLIPTKTCRACGQEKPATEDHFYPQKLGKYGFTSKCRPCKLVEAAALRQRPDQKARQKAWRDANAATASEYGKAYRAAGYSSTKAVAKWRRKNIDWARTQEAARMRAKRRDNPSYRLLCRLRARINSMANGRASRRTEELLGYTMAQFCSHIERQFAPGMGWHNIGEWEIDHILPVAFFTVATVDDADFKACWALTNLQPLWRAENRSKNAKVLTLL
jgi:hypothetical protein